MLDGTDHRPKLNFDGSANQKSLVAAIMLCTSITEVLNTSAVKFGPTTPIVAEALALRECLLIARSLNIPHLLVEGDNQVPINMF